MRTVSIVIPCYNEEDNVIKIYDEIEKIFENVNGYTHEYIFIDNASCDNTVNILKNLAQKDKKVKLIINSRNFGPLRSHYYGVLQGTGDAVVILAADMQDPPDLIPEFIKKWEEGFKIVVGVKEKSQESRLMFALRKLYYKFVSRISGIKLIENFTGFGLYDKSIIDILKELDDPYPYFRGLLCEIGFEKAKVTYSQPLRQSGLSKCGFYIMYDMAMMGITGYSKLPLRIATVSGFIMSVLSLFAAFIYFIYKLVFWDNFSLGVAPAAIGLFLFSSVQLFFIGILGEYVGTIYTQVVKRPLVIEKERVNF